MKGGGKDGWGVRKGKCWQGRRGVALLVSVTDGVIFF